MITRAPTQTDARRCDDPSDRRRTDPDATPRLIRTRWAAIGAAIAVTLGSGGLLIAEAAPTEPSTFVSIDPVRIVDTRIDIALDGPIAPDESRTVQITGLIPTQPSDGGAPEEAEVVPSGATSVVLNLAVVRPASTGFASLRPGAATGTPTTSSLNFGRGGPTVANAVLVQLDDGGAVDLFVSGTVGAVLIDVVGYHLPVSDSVGVNGFETVRESVTLGSVGTSADVTVSCPAGKVALSGGQGSIDGFKRLDVWRSWPANRQEWRFSYTVLSGGAGQTVDFFANCATRG